MFVNELKTEFAEFAYVRLADTKELTPIRKSIRREKLEKWRTNNQFITGVIAL